MSFGTQLKKNYFLKTVPVTATNLNVYLIIDLLMQDSGECNNKKTANTVGWLNSPIHV